MIISIIFYKSKSKSVTSNINFNPKGYIQMSKNKKTIKIQDDFQNIIEIDCNTLPSKGITYPKNTTILIRDIISEDYKALAYKISENYKANRFPEYLYTFNNNPLTASDNNNNLIKETNTDDNKERSNNIKALNQDLKIEILTKNIENNNNTIFKNDTQENKKYDVIIADPPWAYNNFAYTETNTGKKAIRGCAKEYSTMTLLDIKNLPVYQLSNNSCALFLWVTWPFINEAFEVIKQWGFKFKTIAFIWLKTNKKNDKVRTVFKDLYNKDRLPQNIDIESLIQQALFTGMGFYTRSNTEVCLLAFKDNTNPVNINWHLQENLINLPIDINKLLHNEQKLLSRVDNVALKNFINEYKKQNGALPVVSKDVHSVIISKVSKHSEKPKEVYTKIERLFGNNLNKLELFAREKHNDWDVWGDEVNPDIDFPKPLVYELFKAPVQDLALTKNKYVTLYDYLNNIS